MSDLFTFSEDAALGADKAMAIESGVHTMTITECKRGTSKGGAKFVEFSFENADGAGCKYVTLYLTKKDGTTTAFGHGIFMSMIALLGLKDTPLKWEAKGESQVCPTLAGKVVKVALQKQFRYNGAGELKYGFNILHFFDIKTGCTYSELKENKPAKVITWPIEDVQAESNPTNGGSAPVGNKSPVEDDLPF